MKVTFTIDKDKSVGYSLKFDDADKISGRKGLILIAQYIINSLDNN